MSVKYIINLITLLLISYCNVTIASDNFLKKITSNHGLIHNSVFAITQDSEGFMWFGTAKGLSKYDGIKFVNYTYSAIDSTGIPEGDVSQLTTDGNGDIWLRIRGEIALFDKVNNSFIVFGKRRKGIYHLPYHINQISKDQKGNIWLSTNEGIHYYDYTKEIFLRYELLPDEIKYKSIKAILQDKIGRLWIVRSEKLYRINHLDRYNDFEVVSLDSLFNDKRPLSRIKSINEDSNGNVYLSIFGKGVVKIGTNNKITKYAKNNITGRNLSSNETIPLEFDRQGRCWVGTELGINIIERKNIAVKVIQQDFNNPVGLNDNAIHSLYRDRQGNMWIGTYFGGVNVQLANRKEFYHYKAGKEPFFLSGKAVSHIIEDEKEGLWIATEDNGVNYFSVKDKSFTHYTDKNKKHISYNNVHALLMDYKNSIWIGTYLGGLNHYSNGKFSYYRKDNERYGLKSDNIFALCEDDNKKIWIGTTSGLIFFDPKQEVFSSADGDLKWAFIYDLKKDSNGNIWIGSNGKGIWLNRKGDNKIISITDVTKQTNLKPNKIIGISESSDGWIWFATDGEGVFYFNPKEKTLHQYTKDDGLPDNTIYAIVEDDNNDIWMSSNSGLVLYNRRNNTFKSYTTSNGLPVNQFNFKSGYKHTDGTLYFGTVDGMISFRTENISVNDTPLEVRITNLFLHNNSITPNSEEKILSQPIFNTSKIELEYNQTEIGFEFVAIDYAASEQNKFAYKLEGYDDNWIEVGNYNKAFYSRIPAGNYTFKVKACNSDGIWNEKGVELQLRIQPSFWNSYTGYILYLILITAITLLIYYWIWKRRKEKNELLQAKLEKEQNENLNKLKLEFYTQVSHELRTPLSLILDPLHNLIDHPDSTSSESLLKLVLKNANRLQLMVNQLLDFRKTEENHFKLNIIKGDLSIFSENIFKRFIELARNKEIDYTFDNIDVNNYVFYDTKVVDIILYNLLSNAIKYTHKGGEVTCQLFWKNKNRKVACIKVSDNGIGMKKENADRIFENFYVINTDAGSRKSMGIGLSLVYKLVKLHYGNVWVETKENKGSTFCVELPVSEEDFSKPTLSVSGNAKNANLEMFDDSIFENNNLETKNKKHKLLLVEDHEDLQIYLKDFLENYYFVFTANNGVEALKVIETENPDVIVSDVMMPLMDGFDLCNKVKSNIETSHIPVVLLTARSSEEDQAEGLENGADVYISKPFNSKILQAQLSNLLNHKNVLKKRFEQELGIKISELTYSNKDEEFIKKAI